MDINTDLNNAYQIFVDEKGVLNLVTLKSIEEPNQNTRLAELIEKDFLEILNGEKNKKYNMIVNLVPVGKGGYASSKARKIYARMSANTKINKYAIVGGNVFNRTLASFIIRAA